MKNVITLLIISCFCFACSGTAVDANNSSNAKNEGVKAATAGPIMNPNKVAYEAFAALQTNDVNRFKSIFIRDGLRDDFIKMLTAVELTPEQREASIGELDINYNYWTENNGAAVERVFNDLRQQGFDKGIDWKNTVETKFNTEMKQVTVFQMYVNLYEVVMQFQDQNQVTHQLTLPYNYYLESGIVAGAAVLDF